MKLHGNTVLITGGASGIGLEFAKELVARGNQVIVTGRDQVKLKKAKAAVPGLETIASDVTSVEAVDALYRQVVSEFPEVNVVFNNAGVMRTQNFNDPQSDLSDFTHEIDVNLKGPIWITTRFLAHLRQKPESAIVNVSSGLAFVPLPVSPIYCATKAALHSFTISLRQQLKRTNVRVIELCPPATKTELLAEFDPGYLEGVKIMPVGEMVSRCLRGIEHGEKEICPGQSSQLRFMNRLAPGFIQGQLGKTVDKMLAPALPAGTPARLRA